MKALSLFSGIGGIDLACEWAGIETVAFCEREPFCQKVAKTLLGTSHWGSTKCLMTWETLDTPRNRLLFRLAVSGRITDENGFSLLPTPTSSMWRGAAKNRYRGSRHYKASFTGSIEEWTRRSAVYEPKLSRSHNGLPRQMDRIKATSEGKEYKRSMGGFRKVR